MRSASLTVHLAIVTGHTACFCAGWAWTAFVWALADYRASLSAVTGQPGDAASDGRWGLRRRERFCQTARQVRGKSMSPFEVVLEGALLQSRAARWTPPDAREPVAHSHYVIAGAERLPGGHLVDALEVVGEGASMLYQGPAVGTG